MTAAEYLARYVLAKYRPYAKVVVLPAKGLGAVYVVKPDEVVPDDDENATIFIRIEETDIP